MKAGSSRGSTLPHSLPGGMRDWRARARALVRLGRPRFLAGGVVLYALGAAVAVRHGHPLNPVLYLLGQAAVTLFQLMTHYANDYFDYEADRANATPTRWSGGCRVLVGGELPRGVALGAALGLETAGMGVIVALAGMARTDPLIAPALVVALGLAWAYSAPPWRLHSSGLGELAVVLVVTGLVPFFGFALQAPDLVGLHVLGLAVVPLACLQFALLLALEFPDAAGDRAVGKRTCVVRLGPERATRLYVWTVAAAYVSLPALVAAGLPHEIALAAAGPAPVALWRLTRTYAGDCQRPERWESLTFWAVMLLAGTAVMELVGMISF